MGGSAFADPDNPAASLLTPRMPAHIYEHVRDHALHIIRNFYVQAECPIEAPSKPDFGHVDILVASPKDRSDTRADTTTASIAAALGAVRYKRSSPVYNFALPWPAAGELGEELPSVSTNDDNDMAVKSTDTQRYVQLDLHVCQTLQNFQWELFYQAHGDLWMILGGMIRPYGLVINNTGLHLRLLGLDDMAKDKRTIPLTASPSAVLRYLGLDESIYWKPFGSVDAMFAYAASCRFYNPHAYETKVNWNANDRSRMKKRPIFMKWHNEYLQEHRGDAPGRSVTANRQEVIGEAKTEFGVEREYEEKRKLGLREMSIQTLWSNIRKGLQVEGLRIGVI